MPLNDVCLPAGSESEILTCLVVKPLYTVKSNLQWFMVLVGDRGSSCSMLDLRLRRSRSHRITPVVGWLVSSWLPVFLKNGSKDFFDFLHESSLP